MTEPNRTLEERRSTVTSPRPGWIHITTPAEQRDRPDMDLVFRSKTLKSYGFFFNYEHPTTPGVMLYVEDGKFCVENLPISELDAAMVKAES
jgi:hypothetical protein